MRPIGLFWLLITSSALAQATLTVSPQGPFTGVQAAIDAAREGDVVRVAPGVYREHLVIDKPLVLIGEPGAIIDGGGEGTILTVRAPGSRIEGLTLRHSGRSLAREDAGIRLERAENTVLVNNRLEEVLFGLDIRQSHGAHIADNVIVGKDLSHSMRGDGIKLWYSHDVVMRGNEIRRTRDVLIWYSRGTTFENNLVIDGRYGLHYMYAEGGIFTNNRFVNSAVGSYVMFTQHIRVERNIFSGSHDIVGYGLAFKDADDIWVTENLFIGNYAAIHLDNTPSWPDSTVLFQNNVIAGNGVAVSWLPNVGPAVFTANSFLRNAQAAQMQGSGAALPIRWSLDGIGNYWDDYVGFDNGQGIGAVPHRIVRHVDVLLSERPEAQFLLYSPVAAALGIAERAAPVWSPKLLIEDPAPLLAPSIPEPFRTGHRVDGVTLILSLLLVLVALGLSTGALLQGGVRL